MNVNATQLLEATTFSAAHNFGDNLNTKNVVSHPNQGRNLFYVSSQTQKEKNKIEILEFFEENNKIQKQKTLAVDLPIQKIIPSNNSANENQFYAILDDFSSNEQKNKIILSEASLPNDSNSQSSGQQEDMKIITEIQLRNAQNIVNDIVQPQKQNVQILVSDNKEINAFDLQTQQYVQKIQEEQQNINNILTMADPHHPNLIVNAQDNNVIQVLDIREQKSKFLIEDAHNLDILDMDFNPNKQYYFQTCGMDNLVKFWDMRKTSYAIKCLDDLNNMPLSSKYNHYHDQLNITSFNDGSVQLYKTTSISSVPLDSGSMSNTMNTYQSKYEDDGIIKVYDEHEDSVYSLAWSNASAWIFASISLHGNFIVNLVPSSEKYKILL